MPKFRFVFRPVKYLSERGLRSRGWRLSTRIIEHLDIRFDRWRTLRHFVRSDNLSHLGSCSFSELRLLDVPPLYKSSASVEIDWTFLDTILRMIFSSLLKSAIYDVPLTHRFGWSVALT
jgi:hypothetical protein